MSGFPNIHCAVSDCELEKRSTGASAGANRSLGDARLFARCETVVSVYDLPVAKDLRIDVAIESGREIDVYDTSRQPDLNAHYSISYENEYFKVLLRRDSD